MFKELLCGRRVTALGDAMAFLSGRCDIATHTYSLSHTTLSHNIHSHATLVHTTMVNHAYPCMQYMRYLMQSSLPIRLPPYPSRFLPAHPYFCRCLVLDGRSWDMWGSPVTKHKPTKYPMRKPLKQHAVKPLKQIRNCVRHHLHILSIKPSRRRPFVENIPLQAFIKSVIF